MISKLLARHASSQVPYVLLALVFSSLVNINFYIIAFILSVTL